MGLKWSAEWAQIGSNQFELVWHTTTEHNYVCQKLLEGFLDFVLQDNCRLHFVISFHFIEHVFKGKEKDNYASGTCPQDLFIIRNYS